jgi:hypothetical protein
MNNFEEVEDLEDETVEMPASMFEPINCFMSYGQSSEAGESKKKVANPEKWKKNVNKRRKMEGLPYETKKGIQNPKVPKPIDCSNCKYR